MNKYNLFYKYGDGSIQQAPAPVHARSLAEAEDEGRTILSWAGGIDKEQISDKIFKDMPDYLVESSIQLANSLRGLPVFDHAEPTAETVKKQRVGQCRHGVTAKYCNACK